MFFVEQKAKIRLLFKIGGWAVIIITTLDVIIDKNPIQWNFYLIGLFNLYLGYFYKKLK